MLFNENFKNYLLEKKLVDEDQLLRSNDISNLNLIPLHFLKIFLQAIKKKPFEQDNKHPV